MTICSHRETQACMFRNIHVHTCISLLERDSEGGDFYKLESWGRLAVPIPAALCTPYIWGRKYFT